MESCSSSLRLDVRSAPAIRPVWCLDPPMGEHAQLQLQRSASLSQLAGRHSRQTTTNYGQCIDLERHVFRFRTPEGDGIKHKSRVSLSSRCQRPQRSKRISNSQPCPTKPGGQNLAAEPRGSMPVAERRQSKDSDEIHQEPEGRMVGRGGLEPPTSRLSGVRSNQLSYRPDTCNEGICGRSGLKLWLPDFRPGATAKYRKEPRNGDHLIPDP